MPAERDLRLPADSHRNTSLVEGIVGSVRQGRPGPSGSTEGAAPIATKGTRRALRRGGDSRPCSHPSTGGCTCAQDSGLKLLVHDSPLLIATGAADSNERKGLSSGRRYPLGADPVQLRAGEPSSTPGAAGSLPALRRCDVSWVVLGKLCRDRAPLADRTDLSGATENNSGLARAEDAEPGWLGAIAVGLVMLLWCFHGWLMQGLSLLMGAQ